MSERIALPLVAAVESSQHASSEVSPVNTASAIELRLVNGFRIRRAGCDIDLPLCLQRVVAFLALAGRPTRAGVAGTLWPVASESHASASLRSALWRVNKILPGVVRAEHSTLSLGHTTDVDVVRLRARINAALTGEFVDETELLSEELNGDLLPGWDEDWILLEREHLRLLRIRAVEATSDHLRREGRLGAALLAAYLVIREEPLRESAHRLAVQIHIEDGNLVDAVRQVQHYSETLRRELGARPSAGLLTMLSDAGLRSARDVSRDPSRAPCR